MKCLSSCPLLTGAAFREINEMFFNRINFSQISSADLHFADAAASRIFKTFLGGSSSGRGRRRGNYKHRNVSPLLRGALRMIIRCLKALLKEQLQDLRRIGFLLKCRAAVGQKITPNH
ncbi:hypothetical protein AMECASPLE_011733 [Ameca splendens]|uniref:Uncharacterized protein n=1 Tax=Ameca splendens TaxID=208324 RepID=A0ABV0YBS1_9TELE